MNEIIIEPLTNTIYYLKKLVEITQKILRKIPKKY